MHRSETRRPAVVAAASGAPARNAALFKRVAEMFPDHELMAFSEFPPQQGTWIPYQPQWPLWANWHRLQDQLQRRPIAFTALVLEPQIPLWKMRLIAFGLRPFRCLLFNENMDHFRLHPRSVPQMVRHLWWRGRNFVASQTKPQARWRKWLRRLGQPGFRKALFLWIRRQWALPKEKAVPVPVPEPEPLPEGVSVIGPPRDLAAPMPLEFVQSPHQARFRWLVMGDPCAACVSVLAERLEKDQTLFSVQAAAGFRPDSRARAAYVLAPHRGVAVFDTRKVKALNGAAADPLTLRFRAWLAGWPSIEFGGPLALLAPPERALPLQEQSGLPPDKKVLYAAIRGNQAAMEALRQRPQRRLPENQRRAAHDAFALTRGEVAWFDGKPPSGKPRILVASPYAPFPLAHGGAVRMYNLMRRAAADYDQTLVVFVDRIEPPPAELLEIFCHVVQVVRRGSHSRPLTDRPDVVEEFDSPAFRAALRTTVARWKPAIVQLEYTRMAMYAADCAPARTILVEHDVKMDLYGKLVREHGTWMFRQQYQRWQRFERSAWQTVDAAVVMSEQDRLTVGPCAVSLPNGVDIGHFAPSSSEPDSGRLLFIGSFGHLPNLMALEFFLAQVWPMLESAGAKLHIIAGKDPEMHLRHHGQIVTLDLGAPGIELEGFVSDVRPAYRRASVVIAPLTVSAGTNIKVLEAMAMGKALVSTSAGVNGLGVDQDSGVLVTDDPGEMARLISGLLARPGSRRELERRARQTAVAHFNWNVIAARQADLYRRFV